VVQEVEDLEQLIMGQVVPARLTQVAVEVVQEHQVQVLLEVQVALVVKELLL
jgi:hypothetical protein